MLKIDTNQGVIDYIPSPADFVAGTIPYVERTSDWAPYLPSNEPQSQGFDTFGCMSFSALNVIETQLNWYLASGELSEAHRAHLEGVVINGKANLSDRFLAKASGTTDKGNSATIVCDTLRHMGFIGEVDYPSDWDNWNDYYAPIPSAILSQARKALDLWDIQYEIIWSRIEDANVDILHYHLKQAPLQLLTRVCPGWNTGDVPACDPYPTQHATMCYRDTFDILDTYSPYQKHLQVEYRVPFVMKIVITPKMNYYINKNLKYFAQARDVAYAMYQVLLNREPESTQVLDAHATKLADGWNRGDHESTKQFYEGFIKEIKEKQCH